MHNVDLENSLIIVDIVDVMQDYVSLQPNIDETKVKAASIVAQKIDIKRLIGATNVSRCVDPAADSEDEKLRTLLLPVISYFTYSRLLKMFPGTFTDSGYIYDSETADVNVTRTTASQMASIAEAFMEDVYEFLEAETDNDEEVSREKLTPRIRVFGGEEHRSSN